MSVVVAVKQGTHVVLAADSQHTFGSGTPGPGNLQQSKIRQVGPAYLAATSWTLYDNILDDFLGRGPEVSLQTRPGVFAFFKALWKALHEEYSFVNDQCEDKDTPFGDLDASFLVATAEHVFYVSSDMCVTEFHRYHAIGSGAELAIGALHALIGQDLPAAVIARRAVEAAIDHNITCGGPVEIIQVA